MKGKLLVAVIAVMCSVFVGSVMAGQRPPGKNPHVSKQEPAGEYQRCEEKCPPPGLTATPAEVWCANRPQCSSQQGCGCRLFQRKRGTTVFAYAAEAEVHLPREPDTAYVCWCTKKKEQ